MYQFVASNLNKIFQKLIFNLKVFVKIFYYIQNLITNLKKIYNKNKYKRSIMFIK